MKNKKVSRAKPKKSKRQDAYSYSDPSGNDKGSRKISRRMTRNDSDVDDEESDYDIEDDESIDDDGSEVGWNEDDELEYGKFFFKGKEKVKGKNKVKVQTPIDDDSDQEVAHDGMIFLSDLLDQNLKEMDEKSKSKSKTASKEVTVKNSNATTEEEEEYEWMEEEDKISNVGDEDDDDEDDDDKDINDSGDDSGDDSDNSDHDSDSNANGDEHSDDGSSYQGSDNDLDAEQMHERLLNAIDKFANSDDISGSRKPIKGDFQQANESAVYNINNNSSSHSRVSMDALLSALDDGSTSAVKKTLYELEKGLSTNVPKYVDKVVSQRAERQITYSSNKEDMGKWQGQVAANRHVRTLDLAQDKRQNASTKSLVRRFEPENEFEKEIQMVLVKTGIDSEKKMEEREQSSLNNSNFSLEEMKQKQAELAKVKALMFYEQMKRHRLNKIKSKAYHRIRKRQRLKRESEEKQALLDMDPELAQEVNEDDAYKRVKERMSLKHQNTSRWARMALEHGQHDKDLKQAYRESLQLGQELKKRVNKADDPSIEYEVDSDDSGNNGNDKRNGQKASSRAALAINKVLEGYDDQPEVTGKYKKLFEMDFMKKAQSIQREKAKEEAQALLKELEDMERESGGSDDSDRDIAPVVTDAKDPVHAQKLKAAGAEMANMLSKGSGMAITATSKSKGVKFLGTTVAIEGSHKSENIEKSGNPWLDAPKVSKRISPANSNMVVVALSSKPTSSDSPAVSAKQITNNKKNDKIPIQTESMVAAGSSKESEQKKPLLVQRTQEDLVNLAFAGPDYEKEFQSHKKQQIDDELGIDAKQRDIIDKVKAGWGDWAGPGNGGVSKKILNNREKLLSIMNEEEEEKRGKRKDSKLKNVMISDKRIKTAAKYKIADFPHPFTSSEEYEKSLQVPLGPEWNASHVVRKNAAPEILLRPGRIVEPIKLDKKRKAKS